MSILVVSTYPPKPCGIGQYASQQAISLKREGHQVDVLAMNNGDGEFNADLLGGARILRLLKYLWAYQSVYIHYTPFFYFRLEKGYRMDRLITSMAFMMLMILSRRRITFIIHETEYQIGDMRRGMIRHILDGIGFRLAGNIVFHSNREKEAFAEFYRLNPASERLEVWPQEKYYIKRCADTREKARQKLGLERSRSS